MIRLVLDNVSRLRYNQQKTIEGTVGKYIPDYWVIVHIGIKEGSEHYRVFATWSGGYLNGDSWKLNSGIDAVQETEDAYIITGGSGSEYICMKHSYGVNTWGSGILRSWKEQYGDKFTILWDKPEDLNQFIYPKRVNDI